MAHATPDRRLRRIRISKVTKEITGEKTPADQTFDFHVEWKDKDQEGVAFQNKTASITGSGETSFGDITFSKAGTYTFQVSEISKSIPGYSMDGAVYDVVVEVVDRESQLVVDSVTYTKNGKSADKIVFTNTYSTTSVSYAPQIRKVITGDIPPVNKDFHFEIKNKNSAGVTMPASTRAAVSGVGKASFGEITFTKAGTYTFEIREVKDAEHGYTYSDEVYTLTIEVVDVDSVLQIRDIKYQAAGSDDISKEYAEFTNVYSESPASYGPLVIKEIDGEEPPTDKTFEFKIAGKEGDPEGYTIADDTVTINGRGSVNFEPITFKKAGTYSFEISETAGTENGYTYDTGIYTLEVKVINDDSDLKITEVKYYKGADEETAARFVNSYAVKSTAFQIPVKKVLTGSETPDDKDFSFKLAGEDVPGYEIGGDSLKLTGAGEGAFEPITFTKAGTYTFTVSETAGTDKGYVYDTTVYTVTITVGDHDSQLQVDSVVYETDGKKSDAVVFTNRYEEVYAVFQPQVRKVITGAEPQADQKFEFTLTAQDTDGLVMPGSAMATVFGQGTAMFDAVTFLKAGTYTFEIREVDGGLPGYTYSEEVWTLTVQVTEEDNVLTLQEITYQAGEEQRTDAAEFVNVHRTGSLVVKKELVFEGHLLHALDQQFYVALYSDAECADRVSDVKELVFEDEISEEVIFDGLDIGKVYYVSECTEDGTALSSGYLADGTYFQAVFADGNEVLLEDGSEQVQKNFSNEFLHIPKNYYYQGELTVEKMLQDAEGNPKTSHDIFYIGVFEDEAHTKLSDAVDPNILTLDMAGNAVATATVYTRTPDENGLKLYLAEVDENGVLVQGTKEFAYNVAMSSDAPMLTLENDHATVAVTNQEKYEEPETESGTESETEQAETKQTETVQPTEQTRTENETNAARWVETEQAKAVGTGDETNVRLYMILLALSAGMTAAVLAGKRRKRKKG